MKHHLTNEEFVEAYANKFELALHIISIAQNHIRAGEEVVLSRLLNEMRKEAQAKMHESKMPIQSDHPEV